MENVIESKALVKDYRAVRALNGVDIQVRQGEIFGFLGPNGAGKTTFVKTMLNFVRASSGDIRVLGDTPSRLNRERIGYLPERVSIHGFLTAREFLRYQARMAGLNMSGIETEIDSVLARVKMSEAADRRIGGFSKGMMQRVGLAQALLGSPELLILDEPNSGLDPMGVLEIREAILSEKERGATVFLNSHQLLEVEKTCDRVAILDHGNVVAQGSRDELAGQQGIELELEEALEPALACLREADPKVNIQGKRATLSISDPELERTLPARLIDKGARIIYYSQKRESLEEVFKRLVKGKEG